MELLQILGWIYLGVMLGSVFGVIALSLFIGPKMKQYQVNIEELEEEKRVLKAQLTKSYKRGKPQPRKKRTWKRKPSKK
jgi:hypothetical protein